MRPEPFGVPQDTAIAGDRESEARVRVLLVEDDEDDYLITRDMLAEQDSSRFELDWRSDYDEALRAIRLQNHDVYLIDYRLGERTGLQLMREGFADRPSAPVIMLTGQPTHEIDLEATALGVTDFLVKQELAAAGLERSIRHAISHQKAERHALAARAANDGIWDWDLEADRIYLSPRWHAILGLPERARERHPSAWFSLVAPEDLPRLTEAINAHVAGATDHLECEHRLRHADGGWRWVTARGLVSRGVDGAPVRIAGSLSDLTDQRTAQLRLEHEALHDTLTGLPNRTLFMDRVGHRLHGSTREPSPRCAVLFLDLDGFKQVNDQLSHAVGDRLLIGVAERLRATLRPGDTVARLGGDEFTLLLDRIADPADAVEIAERLLSALQQPFPVHGNTLSVGVSIGVALSSPGVDPAELLANADVAMYEAKERGRGCLAVFDDGMRRRLADRQARQDEVRHVVAQGLLEIHFQPRLGPGLRPGVSGPMAGGPSAADRRRPAHLDRRGDGAHRRARAARARRRTAGARAMARAGRRRARRVRDRQPLRAPGRGSASRGPRPRGPGRCRAAPERAQARDHRGRDDGAGPQPGGRRDLRAGRRLPRR
jgi:diguanylate cyclase (GGDEF)-like protein/PAS domain S-box-containing protein